MPPKRRDERSLRALAVEAVSMARLRTEGRPGYPGSRRIRASSVPRRRHGGLRVRGRTQSGPGQRCGGEPGRNSRACMRESAWHIRCDGHERGCIDQSARSDSTPRRRPRPPLGPRVRANRRVSPARAVDAAALYGLAGRPCPGPKMSFIFATASKPSTWGGWWHCRQPCGSGFAMIRVRSTGFAACRDPGPWHTSH
jgi:hypothetical protein